MFSVSPKNYSRDDSTVIKIVIPAKEQEKKVFSEVDLEFAKKVENRDVGLWDRFWNWLIDLIFGKSDSKTKRNVQSIFTWTLVLGGLSLIIWLLTRTQFTSFLKGNTKNTMFNFSDIDEDISNIDFNARVNIALQDNDYRLAVRWLYLKQLYLLNEKNNISYQPFKTNIDYIQELSKSTFQKPFITISRIYDYVWYGKYLINYENYQKLESEFKQFERSINV